MGNENSKPECDCNQYCNQYIQCIRCGRPGFCKKCCTNAICIGITMRSSPEENNSEACECNRYGNKYNQCYRCGRLGFCRKCCTNFICIRHAMSPSSLPSSSSSSSSSSSPSLFQKVACRICGDMDILYICSKCQNLFNDEK
jgi:hypothetical protein